MFALDNTIIIYLKKKGGGWLRSTATDRKAPVLLAVQGELNLTVMTPSTKHSVKCMGDF